LAAQYADFRLRGQAQEGEVRQHVQDVSAPRTAQVGQEELAAVDDAPEIDAHQPVEILEGKLFQGRGQGDARVVYEQMDGAVGVDHLPGQRLHGVPVGHAGSVDGDVPGPLARQGPGLQHALLVHVHQRPARPALRQPHRQGAPDAVGRTRHDRNGVRVDVHRDGVVDEGPLADEARLGPSHPPQANGIGIALEIRTELLEVRLVRGRNLELHPAPLAVDLDRSALSLARLARPRGTLLGEVQRAVASVSDAQQQDRRIELVEPGQGRSFTEGGRERVLGHDPRGMPSPGGERGLGVPAAQHPGLGPEAVRNGSHLPGRRPVRIEGRQLGPDLVPPGLGNRRLRPM
jgi:hypothetical protein